MKIRKQRILKPHPEKVVQVKQAVKADDPTRKIIKPGMKQAEARQVQAEEPKTRVLRFGHDPVEKVKTPNPSIDFMNELIVGWLVIIKGPGQGQALKIGYGHNSIGRSAKERIALDFGDDGISRKRHTTLTYDPRGRKFYLQQGDGVNLIYLNDAPLIGTQELAGGETIELGQTVLKFVPLCGPDFDWQDQIEIKSDGKK